MDNNPRQFTIPSEFWAHLGEQRINDIAIRGYFGEDDVKELWKYLGRTDEIPTHPVDVEWGRVDLDLWHRRMRASSPPSALLRKVTAEDLEKVIDGKRWSKLEGKNTPDIIRQFHRGDKQSAIAKRYRITPTQVRRLILKCIFRCRRAYHEKQFSAETMDAFGTAYEKWVEG